MYHCYPHHSGRQIESSTVKEIMPREEEAPSRSETPVVTEQSLKGARNGAESPGALYKEKIPCAGQHQQQDRT